MTDPSPLEQLEAMFAKVKAAQAKPIPKLARVHPLDLARIPKVNEISRSFGMDITRLTGIPCQPDCGVARGHPEFDYVDDHGNTVTVRA